VAAQASLITFHSGNGSVGTNDALFTFLAGPVSSDFATLTAVNFTSAQTGPHAFIIANNPNWLTTLTEDPTAKWLGTNATAATGTGDTALYAISFNLPAAVVSATLDLHFAVDNQLGATDTNVGIFLNGTAVSSAFPTAGYGTETAFNSSTVGASLHAGTNTLYFDAVNLGGPAGFIVAGTLTTVDAGTPSVPEPATFVLLGGALVALGCIRFRRARAQRR
jgi:hypothetical protein